MRYFIVFLIFYLIQAQGFNFHGVRKQRTLIYPDAGSHIQLIMGVGLPLVLNQESMLIGMVIKASYKLPYNGTMFTKPTVQYAKKKRSVTRWDLYETMAQATKMYYFFRTVLHGLNIVLTQGFGDKECILRTICEVADSPFDQNKSLLEELLHTIFTPSSTKELLIEHENGIYHAAEKLGREAGGKCQNIFPDCEVNFAHIFTRLRTA